MILTTAGRQEFLVEVLELVVVVVVVVVAVVVVAVAVAAAVVVVGQLEYWMLLLSSRKLNLQVGYLLLFFEEVVEFAVVAVAAVFVAGVVVLIVGIPDEFLYSFLTIV